jgi:6-phosphofructokinase 2
MTRLITLTPNPTYDFAVDADFVAPNRKLRCRNPKVHPGGGGLNVARAARRLGADVLAVFTAGGVYGAALKALVAKEGVEGRAVAVAGETRLAFHVKDLSGPDEYRFNLPGAELSERECAALLAALEEETRKGDYVVGSGSLPPIAGGKTDLWARAARVARRRGARFVLDSISGLKEALAEGVFLLRLNEHEYPALAGRTLQWPDEIAGFAKSIVAGKGAERMAISHGADGSVLASLSGVLTQPVFKVRAHSAVGAGDSFVAGLVVALMDGRTDAEALRMAAAAAAATRMKPDASLLDVADLQRLLERGETDGRTT